MRRLRPCLGALLLAAAALAVGLAPPRAQEKAADAGVPLLAGKLTDHWTTNGNWVLDDGVLALVPRKGESGWQRYGDYLWSEKPYQDFEIEFEYKVLAGGRSAFLFHVADVHNPLRSGIEVSVCGRRPPGPAIPAKKKKKDDVKERSDAGTVLNIPAARDATRPDGEWNKMHVAVQANRVVVIVNGTVVNEVSHDHVSILNRPFAGVIGFQDRGLPVWLRNVRIRAEHEERPAVVPNFGAHTGPVQAMAFTPGGDRLVTAQRDAVRVWATASAEAERVWRMPTPIAPVLAVSPDGKTVAVPRDAPGSEGCIWLLNLETGGQRAITQLPRAAATGIRSVRFCADGRSLVWDHATVAGVCDVSSGRLTHVLHHEKRRCVVVLNKDGTRLLQLHTEGFLHLLFYDVPANREGQGVVALKKPTTNRTLRNGQPDAIWWSADGSRYAFVDRRGADVTVHPRRWSETSDVIGKKKGTIVVPNFPVGRTHAQYASADEILLDVGEASGNGLLWRLAWVKLGSGKIEQRKFVTDAYRRDDVRASLCSRNGKYLVLDTAAHLALCDLETGKFRRLGPPQQKPAAVAWADSGRAIAWSVEAGGDAPWAGLRLDTLERLPPEQLKDAVVAQPADWVLQRETAEERKSQTAGLTLVRGGERVETDWSDRVWLWHRSPGTDGKPRLVVAGVRTVGVIDVQSGKTTATFVLDRSPSAVAVSPDGRLCLYAAGGRELYVARTVPFAPLLTVVPAGGDWVAWTPQGYYAATPAGERLIGFTTRQDNFTPLTFHPVDRFRKRLYRPDVIKLIAARADVTEAVRAANAALGEKGSADVRVDQMMPPRAALSLLDREQLPKVRLRVRAEASSPAQPVMAVRLLVDGRPLPGAETHAAFAAGKKEAELEWAVTLPPGKHQLVALVRGPDSSAVSNNLVVEVPDPAKQSFLHVLSIGISAYPDPALRLDFAAKDAGDLARAFQERCKGEPFRDVYAETLADAAARKSAIVERIAGLRPRVRANDLVVIFFAGHGVKSGDRFYLLNVDANPADLPATAISGDELRKVLGEFPCQVLLLLDACHSSAALKNFRPAVDDLTRHLTDDECGVAVLCAAMAHERALEQAGNGLFARAVIDALGRADGVPFNPFNHTMYVHHLHAYVFDRVSHQSGDRQHPFLSLPWVVESFPVVRFAAKVP